MPRKLRIAVWYNLPSGGARRALFDHVSGLLARGHHVEVWRPTDASHREGFSSLDSIVQEHEVPLDEIPERGRPSLNERLDRSRAERAAMRVHSAECARQIGTGGFDVLYAHKDVIHNTPFIGREVAGMPKVVYLQEPSRRFFEAAPDPLWIPRPVPEGNVAKRAFRARRNEVAHQADRIELAEDVQNARAFDRILVNSYFSRESVLRAYGHGGLDVRVCYLGVDLDLFQNLNLPRQRLVVGIGSFAPLKNVEGAIRAIATIARDRPPLAWVGNFTVGDYGPRMTKLSEELGVDLRVKVMISDQELTQILSRAGAMVYAPLLEPFGYAPLEANACGLAVAAVAEGGVRETVADGVNGVLADPDPASLGRAIEAVLGDPAMGERAERHVRSKWGMDRAIDRIENQLLDVVEAHRP